MGGSNSIRARPEDTTDTGYHYVLIHRNDKTAELVARPRELVQGERESFIGGYNWQRNGPGPGSPAMSVDGGGCIRISSRR